MQLTAQQIQDLHVSSVRARIPGNRPPAHSRIVRDPQTAAISHHVTIGEAHSAVPVSEHVRSVPAQLRRAGYAPAEARPRVQIGATAPTFPTVSPALEAYKAPSRRFMRVGYALAGLCAVGLLWAGLALAYGLPA